LLKPGGDCVFNVAIRTVVIDTETWGGDFRCRCGVTIDSTAECEYEECLGEEPILALRGRWSFSCLSRYCWRMVSIFCSKDHVARLNESAEYFGFHGRGLTRIWNGLRENPRGSFKVRVTLWKDGRIETQVTPVELW
jgi:para-aminobenzoate synthetase/4-amino-4-deoxychorismate lyase